MRSQTAAVLASLLVLFALAGCGGRREDPDKYAWIAADPQVRFLADLDGVLEHVQAALVRQRDAFNPPPELGPKPDLPEASKISTYRQIAYHDRERLNALMDEPADPTPISTRYEFAAAHKEFVAARDTLNAFLEKGKDDNLERSIQHRRAARGHLDKLREDLKRYPPSPSRG
jgi:hypothetical protein